MIFVTRQLNKNMASTTVTKNFRYVVPKMEALNLMFGYFGDEFSLTNKPY